MAFLGYAVSLINKARHQLSGEDPSPWYTRWIWWVILGTAVALVIVSAVLINMRLSNLRMQRLRAEQIEEGARLRTINAKSMEEAAKHRQTARDAREAFNEADEKLKSEEGILKDVQAAISRATSLEELDRIAETLK